MGSRYSRGAVGWAVQNLECMRKFNMMLAGRIDREPSVGISLISATVSGSA